MWLSSLHVMVGYIRLRPTDLPAWRGCTSSRSLLARPCAALDCAGRLPVLLDTQQVPSAALLTVSLFLSCVEVFVDLAREICGYV